MVYFEVLVTGAFILHMYITALFNNHLLDYFHSLHNFLHFFSWILNCCAKANVSIGKLEKPHMYYYEFGSILSTSEQNCHERHRRGSSCPKELTAMTGAMMGPLFDAVLLSVAMFWGQVCSC